MAWLGLDRIFLGTDLEAEQARGNELDAQLAAMNRQALETGQWSQAQYDQAQANLQGESATYGLQVTDSVNSEFAAGAREGLSNVLAVPGRIVGAAGEGLGSVLGGILKNVPWWAWLAAAGALFVYMGGLALLRGRLARL